MQAGRPLRDHSGSGPGLLLAVWVPEPSAARASSCSPPSAAPTRNRQRFPQPLESPHLIHTPAANCSRATARPAPGQSTGIRPLPGQGDTDSKPHLPCWVAAVPAWYPGNPGRVVGSSLSSVPLLPNLPDQHCLPRGCSPEKPPAQACRASLGRRDKQGSREWTPPAPPGAPRLMPPTAFLPCLHSGTPNLLLSHPAKPSPLPQPSLAGATCHPPSRPGQTHLALLHPNTSAQGRRRRHCPPTAPGRTSS